jgi:hypothetical protein
MSVWPPLWSSGKSSCLQIQRPGFDSRHYQIFWEVVGLKRGPLSLVSTMEELLEIKSSGSGLENRDYGLRDSSRWQRGTLYPQQLTLTSSTRGGRSVSIVHSRTQAMEFSLVVLYMSVWVCTTPWSEFAPCKHWTSISFCVKYFNKHDRGDIVFQ